MKRALAIITIIAMALDLAILFLTNPHQSGLIGILTFFGALYVALLGVIAFLLFGTSMLMAKYFPKFWIQRPFARMSLLHSYYYASVLALAPVLLIGIGSVAKVGIREIILIVIFIAAATIYVRRMIVS